MDDRKMNIYGMTEMKVKSVSLTHNTRQTKKLVLEEVAAVAGCHRAIHSQVRKVKMAERR